MFNAFNWYWKADDGRLFSSATQALVQASDVAYLAWQTNGGIATIWPRDASGAQSNDALQEVIAPYGMFVDLTTYAANARWQKEVGGITFNNVPISTDDRAKLMIMGAFTAAASNSNYTTSWIGSDGSVNTFNAAQVITMGNAVQTHVGNCFATYGTVKSQIVSGAVATRAQVDAAFAAINTKY
jgi:hypothetical protein